MAILRSGVAAAATAATAALLFTLSSGIDAQVFDVTKYGAVGDGKTMIDDALLSAWKAACASSTPSSCDSSRYVRIREVTIQGPCKAPIGIQLQGTLIAPVDISRFKGDGWVTIQHIDQFTLFGGGIFNGQGKFAWSQNNCNKNLNCIKIPANLRLNFITNALVHGITSLDSKNFHVNVLGCKNITFQHLTIKAPENSPNTDGIHIGRSTEVNITDSNIGTGDDCISIGDGSRQVFVTRVSCGPGHGFSVGSIGRYPNEEPVVGFTVKNCTLTGTQNGVRIKTWPAAFPGVISDVQFEDIQMNNAGNPILIDQKYCPWNLCNVNSPSLVRISNVGFRKIWGTSTTKVAVKLDCSSKEGCSDVEVSDINLAYHGADGPAISVCSNVHPIISGIQNPHTCAGGPA